MEDLRLEHSPETQVGFAEISVLPEKAHALAPRARGTRLALMEAEAVNPIVVAVDGPAGSASRA
jgi:hypothetical protein